MRDIEIWKDEVMLSLQGMERAEPPKALFQRVLQRMEGVGGQGIVQLIPMRTVWLAAAGFALLVMLNLGGMRAAGNKTDNAPAAPYQLDNTNYQLY